VTDGNTIAAQTIAPATQQSVAHPPKTARKKMNHMDRIGLIFGVTLVLTVLMFWLIPMPTL
jgi:hypothetical protein